MEQDKKPTVGKIALDLMNQKQENKDSIAQTQAMLTDYEKNFYDAFDRGKAQFQGDFYVVVLTKKERLMGNVIRNYFIVRESCPTPEFDQIVYKCIKKENAVELLWTVPNIQACDHYRTYPLEVPNEQRDLFNNILNFYDGSLLRLCKKLNKEIKESTVTDSFNPEDFDHQENLVIQS